ncbi:MAG: ANTAR domain-containing protein [Brooklawnia sp.]|uniref:ANTAR domain-containing protein n=1 Tax=Brooklawnia sp. TaxID=2699740 RepID=UPI003C760525
MSARDVIGQAKGILMERMKIPPDRAFDVLRSSSQHLNLKLREVARRLAETGELQHPDTC